MRVFLDTNVLASALATRGLCAALFEAVLVEHELLASAEVLAELRRVLTDKFHLPSPTTEAFIRLVAESAEMVSGGDRGVPGVPDPDDGPLVAAALAGLFRFVAAALGHCGAGPGLRRAGRRYCRRKRWAHP